MKKNSFNNGGKFATGQASRIDCGSDKLLPDSIDKTSLQAQCFDDFLQGQIGAADNGIGRPVVCRDKVPSIFETKKGDIYDNNYPSRTAAGEINCRSCRHKTLQRPTVNPCKNGEVYVIMKKYIQAILLFSIRGKNAVIGLKTQEAGYRQ